MQYLVQAVLCTGCKEVLMRAFVPSCVFSSALSVFAALPARFSNRHAQPPDPSCNTDHESNMCASLWVASPQAE